MNYNNLNAYCALFMGENKPFALKAYPVAPPEEGWALLRLLASGICGTDVHIHRGRLGQPFPLIIGHEFIGEVVDINCAKSAASIGERVIFNMAAPCGKCQLCKAGDSANCLNFDVAYARDPEIAPHFFGGYGQYCYAKAGIDDGALIKIPDNVPTLAAAMFPCAGPTITHALKLGGVFGDPSKISTAIVQGAGPLGLYSALWLRQNGVQVYTVVRDKEGSRASAISSLTGCEVATEQELRAASVSADLCIECSGNPAAFTFGCEILRNRGIYLVPGQYSDSGCVSFGPQIITFKALQIIGSSQYDASDVADYIAFMSAHTDVLPAVAECVKTFPLTEINEAMAAAEAHKYSKVVLI